MMQTPPAMRALQTFADTPSSRSEPSAPQQASQVSSLALTLRALQPLLARPEVTELCINKPHEVFLETQTGWQQEPLPCASFNWCYRLAKLIANATRQRVTEESP